ARDFFEQSVKATLALGRRAVLLIGDARNLPVTPLPPEIIALDYAPYRLLLARACVMVHHGGIGTTAEGLRAGRPTLIVPFAFDQSDNAARAKRLGVSRTLYRAQYKAARVRKELGILLAKPHYARKALQVSARLRTENGAAVACDLIEDVLEKRAEDRELIHASGN
ncbi:MAG TPA: nucleotide disphospho-sugar-binding domain-containing protein, partial [Pyrinomonadaceae bacterium]